MWQEAKVAKKILWWLPALKSTCPITFGIVFCCCIYKTLIPVHYQFEKVGGSRWARCHISLDSTGDICLKGFQDKMIVSDAYQDTLRQQLINLEKHLSQSERILLARPFWLLVACFLSPTTHNSLPYWCLVSFASGLVEVYEKYAFILMTKC